MIDSGRIYRGDGIVGLPPPDREAEAGVSGRCVPDGTRIIQKVELRHLRSFVTAAEQGSFRKASASLRVRESSISRRVRDLEAHLGTALFHRSTSGVRLTAAGRYFFPVARRVFTELAQSAGVIASISEAIDKRSASSRNDAETSGGKDCNCWLPEVLSRDEELGSAPLDVSSVAGRTIALGRLREAAEMLMQQIVLLSEETSGGFLSDRD